LGWRRKPNLPGGRCRVGGCWASWPQPNLRATGCRRAKKPRHGAGAGPAESRWMTN